MKRIKYFTLGFIIVYFIYVIIENLNLVVNTTLGFVGKMLGILSPLLWGIVLAYIMLPLVKFFERHISNIKLIKRQRLGAQENKKRLIRMVSISISLLVLFLIIFLMVYSIYVMVGGSFKDFSWEETWLYMQQYVKKYSDDIRNISTALEDIGFSANMMDLVDSLSKNFAEGIQSIIAILATKIGTIGKYVIDLSFGLVFSINIIYNREYFSKLVDNGLRLVFNEKRRKLISSLFSDINLVLVSFIRGRIIDLTLLSFVTSFALLIINFEFSFLVGFFAGYTNIIPYLGTWIGIVPAVIIALINSGLERAIMVGAYIVILQQVYIMLISPKVQGKSIGLHPFFVLLSLIVFGAFFGLIGMILSIPIAGVIKVIIVRWAKHRQDMYDIELHDLNKYR
jgi:predicted PurR-regulated permease PerM